MSAAFHIETDKSRVGAADDDAIAADQIDLGNIIAVHELQKLRSACFQTIRQLSRDLPGKCKQIGVRGVKNVLFHIPDVDAQQFFRVLRRKPCLQDPGQPDGSGKTDKDNDQQAAQEAARYGTHFFGWFIHFFLR